MTDSSIIQQARDVLAKWRAHRFDTMWEVDTNAPFSADLVGLFAEERKAYAVKFDAGEPPEDAVARLIVGTAGNPDLLDALDGLLVLASRLEDEGLSTAFLIRVERVAAAIVAADKRMTP